ncbi:LysE family translocator [Salinibius halmophilus]|uniref:LysE family translocator n=1 Tax=Salinibius halmophilus TaxID=1853216 RepID=UPI000E65F02E|nr:LysE family translocator [Salinibius halmophilus]
MEFSTWLVYLGVIVTLIVMPGPVALICMTHGLKHGKRNSVATVLGGMLAALCLMALSSLGLGALLAASEQLFTLVKLAGAAYLVYLGVQAWRSKEASFQAETVAPQQDASMWQLFRKGFAVGIANPKDLLFFAALFPSFIDTNATQWSQFLVLSLTWTAVDGVVLFSYALLGTRIQPLLASTRRMKWFNRSTGSLFIAAGSAIAITSR